MCDVVVVREKGNPEGMRARFLIEKSNARIKEIRILDEGGETTSVTALSEYRPVEGLPGQVQPMHVRTEDLKEKTVTEMEITRVAHRPGLKKEEFVLEGIAE